METRTRPPARPPPRSVFRPSPPLSLRLVPSKPTTPSVLPTSRRSQRALKVLAPARGGPESLRQTLDDSAQSPEPVLSEREPRPQFQERREGRERDDDRRREHKSGGRGGKPGA